MKKCGRCQEYKTYDNFNKSSRYKDGLRYECRSCKREEYIKNRAKRIAQSVVWAKNNPEKRKAILKKWNNKAIEYKRAWRQKKFFNNVIEKNFCERCGVEPNDPAKLVVHHSDGNNGKMGKPLNNSRNNLVVLCRPCHPKVHFRGVIREVLTV